MKVVTEIGLRYGWFYDYLASEGRYYNYHVSDGVPVSDCWAGVFFAVRLLDFVRLRRFSFFYGGLWIALGSG